MKLNEEQCLNLPFPIGCLVWYDIRIKNDGEKYHAAATISERREQYDTEKRGGSSGGTDNTATATNRGVFEFAFKCGIVSAAYLDIAASNILYEVTPANGLKMNGSSTGDY